MTNDINKLQQAVDIIDFVESVNAAFPNVDTSTILAFIESEGMDFEKFINEYNNDVGFFAPKKDTSNKLGYNEFEMRTLDEVLKLDNDTLKDIKGVIKAYWSEILPLIVAFPFAYDDCGIEIKECDIYHCCVYPIICNVLDIDKIN